MKEKGAFSGPALPAYAASFFASPGQFPKTCTGAPFVLAPACSARRRLCMLRGCAMPCSLLVRHRMNCETFCVRTELIVSSCVSPLLGSTHAFALPARFRLLLRVGMIGFIYLGGSQSSSRVGLACSIVSWQLRLHMWSSGKRLVAQLEPAMLRDCMAIVRQAPGLPWAFRAVRAWAVGARMPRKCGSKGTLTIRMLV